MRWLVLAACAAPAAAPHNHVAASEPPTTACPWITYDGPGWIAIRHELFPSCPIPFTLDLPVCPGRACPRPCIDRAGAVLGSVERHVYDADGAWIGWKRVKGGLSRNTDHCERTHGVVASCDGREDDGTVYVTTIDRDARGRIANLHYYDGDTYPIHYDDAGRITRMNDIDLAYDAYGRLVSEHFGTGTTETFAYDASGRLVESARRHLIYDERGRLTGVTADNMELAFTYDTRDRLVKWTRIDSGNLLTQATWDYDCR
jgi:YD repeat-containing protein